MKKILLFIGLLLMASFALAAEYNSQTGVLKLTMYKGWNVVPLGVHFYSASSSGSGECTDSDALSAFIYSPVLGRYAGWYKDSSGITQQEPSNSNDLLNAEKANNFYHAIGGGSWVYFKRYCTWTNDLPNTKIDSFPWTLKKGWNMIAVNPWMIGYKLKDLFADCSITGVNVWDSYNQKWSLSSSRTGAYSITANESPIYDAGVGTVFFVKLDSDCKLRLSAQPIVPPVVPE